MNPVDLRSDTVTHPTTAMREAMAAADVGDDVYGEDPTVNRLQELAAGRLGKEAAVFVPSGTMGNLAAMLAYCQRGDEVILGHLAHTFLYEAGGVSALGGVHVHTVPNQPDGTLALEDLQAALRDPHDPHEPRSRLLSLENTHNRCGGAVLTPEYVQAAADLARENGLALHLDGARLFNAAVALEMDPKVLVEPVDSVTFCLSKALAAPVGSVICGSQEFVVRAHRIRKQLGGGMRQAGVLAAAGIVALEQMVDRLAEDHARARELAEGLGNLPGLKLDPGGPQTNILYLTLDESLPLDAPALVQQLSEFGIRVGDTGPRRLRLVTHYQVDAEGVRRTLQAFDRILARTIA
jgi:threonine aldolase